MTALSNNILYIIVAVLLVFQLILVIKISDYRRALEEKNIKLIQFYLDMQFVWKNMIDNLRTSDSVLFCSRLVEDIKSYYNLEDIIIIDSIKMINVQDNSILRSNVISFINKNLDNIVRSLNKKHFQIYYCNFDNNDYILYVSSITPDSSNDGVIVCTEFAPSLLNKNEITSLETSINLLKTRLIYS